MHKYRIDSETLEGLADAIRIANGETRLYKPSEMATAVANIMNSATYILRDAAGHEYYAVFSDRDVVLTATAEDIREGKVAVTDNGLTIGTMSVTTYNYGDASHLEIDDMTEEQMTTTITNLQNQINMLTEKLNDIRPE